MFLSQSGLLFLFQNINNHKFRRSNNTMKCDFHMHSSFSGDSETPMQDMIERAITLGLDTICFTEHYDEDYPEGEEVFSLDTAAYFQTLCTFKEQYRSRIDVRFGVELGMQPHLGSLYTKYISDWPLDFVIASQHVLDHADPYYPSFWKDQVPSDVIHHYFEETLRNLKSMTEYDTLAHLDYIVRYAGDGYTSYHYHNYADVIDPILHYLIEQGKCLEVNTAGFKYGIGHPNPCEEVLKRYRELGGERITIGSDGHKPEHLAYDFDRLQALLTNLGFRYYCIFRERKPEFRKLSE